LENQISLRAALIAFAIAMVILAQGISAPFIKEAEPQAASWIQDVASGRHILIPRDYYGALARKPPLFYWAAAAITVATGGHVNEIRARVVSLFAGAGIAVMVLMWTAQWFDLATGWLAFLFLLGSYAFTSRGTLALEDMMLVAFMFAGWWLLYPVLEEIPSRRRIIAIGVALGFGILTKGPVAIALPAFGALIYLLAMRRSVLEHIRRPWPWMVLAISIAIALPWYLPALLSNGGELAKIMFQENAGHFLPASMGGTGEAARPLYYIAMKMLAGTAPLNFLLPALAVAFIRSDFIFAARRPLLFQLSFLLAMVIFFSLASAKRDDYVLPGIPSVAILFAALFTALETNAWMVERLRNIAAVAMSALAVLGLVVAMLWISRTHSRLLDEINPIDRAQAQLFVKYYIGALSLILVAVALGVIECAALIISGLRRGRPVRTAIGCGALSLLGVLIFTASIRPEMARERTIKYAAAEVDRVSRGAPVYVVTANQELSFYLRREAPVLLGPHQIMRSIEPGALVFAYPGDFQGPARALKDRLRFIQGWDRLGKMGSPALYRFQ
jgi:hypothetical protein